MSPAWERSARKVDHEASRISLSRGRAKKATATAAAASTGIGGRCPDRAVTARELASSRTDRPCLDREGPERPGQRRLEVAPSAVVVGGDVVGPGDRDGVDPVGRGRRAGDVHDGGDSVPSVTAVSVERTSVPRVMFEVGMVDSGIGEDPVGELPQGGVHAQRDRAGGGQVGQRVDAVWLPGSVTATSRFLANTFGGAARRSAS